jgi:oligopeptide transport system ATP-binding protein
MNVLEINGLSVSFPHGNGRARVVDNLDLKFKKGKTTAIVGESGSGKSVTVKSIIGLNPPNASIDSGSALYFPGDSSEPIDLIRLPLRSMRKTINGSRISVVFQDPVSSLNPTITVGKQISEAIRLSQNISGGAAMKETVRLLELVGIDEPLRRAKQYPHQLSGGMCQRIVIAAALSRTPDILICDEPTTALDVTVQARILELIRDLQAQTGVSIIYITHDMSVVANIADYVYVMYAGRVVERGLTEEIFFSPRHPYTWSLLAAMPSLDMSDGKLYSIAGNPPEPGGVVSGDAFAPRNEFALNIDYRIASPMFRVTETHYAATWLLHPNAPKLDRRSVPAFFNNAAL